ncbi:MAG: efflux RND transporter periplasmic adaptor subunit [Oceanospirillaceae bacterium]|nr:efflux RND transporter periplasmic adaptor subunit [Oceanospirillaceae bacterium]MCP5334121.1 efflux RND transporter periplasmic adaptor subunit [Oceanospirillaceae bacterium]
MQNNKTLWLPLLIAGIFAALLFFIFTVKPEAKRDKPNAAEKLQVESQTLHKQNFQVVLNSFGRVQPGIQSTLVAQVSGQITWVNEHLREGGEFGKGDVLLRIDDRDYQVQLDIAKAELASAKAALEEEISKSEQARREWESSGLTIPDNAFALRKPQLAAAKASEQSAQAKLNLAQLNLQRTSIRAPYNGRVKSLNVDLGDVVNSNTSIASLYSTDYAEIRLPIKRNEIPLLGLDTKPDNIQITLNSDLNGDDTTWNATANRISGALDDSTQQIHVIARINKPFTHAGQQAALIPGQYANASIRSKELHDVIVIPNKSLYQGSYVYTIRDHALQKTNVSLLWQNAQHSIIADGLNEGDELVTTPLGQVSSGTPVTGIGTGKTL